MRMRMNNREYNRWIKQGEECARQNPTQYAINQKLAQAEGEAFLRSIPDMMAGAARLGSFQEMEQSDWIGAIEDCREYCDLRPDAYHGPVNYDGRH